MTPGIGLDTAAETQESAPAQELHVPAGGMIGVGLDFATLYSR